MILTLTGTAVQLNFMVKSAFTTMRKEEERERERERERGGGGESESGEGRKRNECIFDKNLLMCLDVVKSFDI